ncbi:DUF1015 domain-containing protein [Lactiplantibacillus modestisalitolerans]|uniref:Uncharacterized protein n=1 Tax=Lactiplantibacillus modestisalitolerans TaxID=1457219 RepID=A0ABV5WVY3_9LACO|nr:DUF1015 domain-containing protein [Lactiplantibacillus modestisalitolerans]
MQTEPFIAKLPTASGLRKLGQNQPDLNAEDQAVQTTASYYWYELTQAGVHQWRLIARWPADQLVTTIVPGQPNTVLYPQQAVLEMLIDDWVGHFKPVVTLTDAAQVTHRLWQVTEPEANAAITDALTAVTPRKTWLTTTSTPLVMLVSDTDWSKFKNPLEMPAHLIELANQ